MNENFEDIYNEYKVVAARTAIVAQVLRPGQPYHVNIIHPEDLIRLKHFARLLVEHFEDRIRDAGEMYEIAQDADEVCTCGHSRGGHGGIQQFEDGEMPPIYKKDGRCHVNNCECQKYTLGN